MPKLTDQQISALKTVEASQAIINTNIELIGDALDKMFGPDLNLLSVEDLEFWIHRLPPHCFYSVDLKRVWRDKTKAESVTKLSYL